MGIYYGLLFLVVLLYTIRLVACQAGASRLVVDKVNNGLIGLSIYLVFALRSTSVGVDLKNYVDRFRTGSALQTRKMDLEFGYAGLNDVVRQITSNPNVFLAIVAAVTIAPIVWTIGKTSQNIYLSWLLFISIGPFSFMLSGLRQGIALAIVFATLPLLAKRKVLLPALMIVGAATFHTSALIFLPAIFIYRLRLDVKTTFAVAAILLAVALFGEQLVDLAIQSVYETYEVTNTGAYRWSLVNMALWLLFVPLYDTVRSSKPSNAGLYLLVLVGVLMLTLSSFATNVGRGAAYYLQFFSVLAPNAISAIEDRRVAVLFSASVAVVCVTYFFLTLSGTAYEVVPYRFFWEDQS